MFRYRSAIAAWSLAAYVAAEVFLSVLAVGHHHHSDGSEGTSADACVSVCPHHGHSHSHAATDLADADPKSPRGTSEPAHDDCSICRHLGLMALSVETVRDSGSEKQLEKLIVAVHFDVASPSYLLPQPRSPPAIS